MKLKKKRINKFQKACVDDLIFTKHFLRGNLRMNGKRNLYNSGGRDFVQEWVWGRQKRNQRALNQE